MTAEALLTPRYPLVEDFGKTHGRRLKTGAGDRDRTGDIQLGKLAFYR
jgi:hypothetical protein